MGFWGPTTSNVDWCEPNYAVSWFVAEFWNTVSNFPGFLVAAYGLYMTQRCASQEQRFWWSFSMIGIVCFGSTLFHATLKWEAQYMDELPMLACDMIFLYCLIENKRRIRYKNLPTTFAVLFGVIVVAYAVYDIYLIFLASYAAMLLAVIFLSCKSYWTPSTSTTSKFFLTTALVLYGSGFAMWVTDNTVCRYVASLHLHAWWHVFSQLATYMFIFFLISERAPVRQNRAVLDIGALPFVKYV